jgi:predicted TIM-barrel fold metal-dependent hydrolase
MVATAALLGRYDLPAPVAAFAGKINDIDSHEAIPANLWVEQFGERTRFLADAMYARGDHSLQRNSKGYALAAERAVDDTEINTETVWKMKAEKAPGAWDMSRRLAVMDFTGVRRQIMYPGIMALRALNLHSRADDPSFFRSITGDRPALVKGAIDAYNDWVLNLVGQQDRLRPVAVLHEETIEDLVASARRLINGGVRGIMMSTSRPPGGFSPAHRACDPLWDLLSQARVPLLSHIGTHDDLLRTRVWRDAEAFEGWKAGEEFAFDPWTLSTVHFGIQNFITVMVQGGVFERFPGLYVGCNEFAAHWIGPLAENMDLWVANQPFPNEKGSSWLTMPPSEYVRRNVRVAPFYFEDVGAYIARYGLEEVYCYGSDYPHHEGGQDPMGDLARSLENHGFSEKMMRRFFVDNATVLFPE